MELNLNKEVTNVQSFVVFTMDSAADRWWNKFLKKPFLHVLIIHTWEMDGRHFIEYEDPVISRSTGKVHVREGKVLEVLHWYSFLRLYRNICMRNHNGIPPKILKLKIFLDKYNVLSRYVSELPLCTAYVMRTMGISTFAVTPYQLYKVLLRRGCRKLF